MLLGCNHCPDGLSITISSAYPLKPRRAEEKNKSIKDIDKITDVKTLDFEDKLILLLREKIGIPKKISWMNARLTSYLKEHNRPSLITAESFQATHIMYRNISFGSLILSGSSGFMGISTANSNQNPLGATVTALPCRQ
ncbi:MAG: hypothetical protein M1G31_15185 [Pseudanabaena sp. Salubria-1]|nr:hypothetical protein [Pseudanabaena sp. Salubria-1]